jgi:hypothetical protein
VGEILHFIQKEGIFLPPRPVSCFVPDPGDLPFIEVALHAQVPVVTGNARHFTVTGVTVMTPAEYLLARSHY